MAVKLGNLNVKVTAETRQFSGGMKRAKMQTTAFTRTVQLGTVALKAMAAAAIALAAILGGVLVVGLKKAFTWMDALGKSADKIGIGTQELYALQKAAQLSGASIEGLDTALVKMQDNIAEAARKAGPAREALEQLGLSPNALSGRGAFDRLGIISDQINKIANQGQRINIAMDLFGRQGATLLPMLEGGSKSLNEMLESAKSMHAPLRAEVKLIEDANDSITELLESLKLVFANIAVKVAPIITGVADALSTLLGGNVGADIGNALVTVAQYVSKSVVGLIMLFNDFSSIILDASTAITMLVEGILLLYRKIANYVGETTNTAISTAGAMTGNPAIASIASYIGGKIEGTNKTAGDYALGAAKYLKFGREDLEKQSAEMKKYSVDLRNASETFWENVEKNIASAQKAIEDKQSAREALRIQEERYQYMGDLLNKYMINPLRQAGAALEYAGVKNDQRGYIQKAFDFLRSGYEKMQDADKTPATASAREVIIGRTAGAGIGGSTPEQMQLKESKNMNDTLRLMYRELQAMNANKGVPGIGIAGP